MINPQDIRIGNIIYSENSHVSKVIGLAPYGHEVDCLDGCDIVINEYYPDGEVSCALLSDSQESNPIRLTEEWVIKAGFKRGLEYNNRNVFYSTGHHSIDLQLSGTDIKPYLLDGHLIRGLMPVEYVHQLQNLYFALTGTELKISL